MGRHAVLDEQRRRVLLERGGRRHARKGEPSLCHRVEHIVRRRRARDGDSTSSTSSYSAHSCSMVAGVIWTRRLLSGLLVALHPLARSGRA